MPLSTSLKGIKPSYPHPAPWFVYGIDQQNEPGCDCNTQYAVYVFDFPNIILHFVELLQVEMEKEVAEAIGSFNSYNPVLAGLAAVQTMAQVRKGY